MRLDWRIIANALNEKAITDDKPTSEDYLPMYSCDEANSGGILRIFMLWATLVLTLGADFSMAQNATSAAARGVQVDGRSTITEPLPIQDVSGDWQGEAGSGKERLRVILHIDADADGSWRATFFSIDQGPDGIPLSAMTYEGKQLTFSIPDLKLSYRGAVSADGRSIVGRLRQGGTIPLTFSRPPAHNAWLRDGHCECTISFVPVQKSVKLEVLDWGGTGRPVILLAGLGDTAHGFDEFAHKLVSKYHVYGITRRGTGESSSPPPVEADYSADRLGDDVLAVLSALKVMRPVLIGHSIAGEELSSIGSRHPEKVAGLVYLDAGYEYAFYDPAHGDVDLDAIEVRKELSAFIIHEGVDKEAISQLLTHLPALQRELEAQQKMVARLPNNPTKNGQDFSPGEAILLGEQKYTKIACPVLTIFADPHDLGELPGYSAANRAALAELMADHTRTHRSEFEAGVPTAQVVGIPKADHYVFKSNESEVLKQIDKFTTTLPLEHSSF